MPGFGLPAIDDACGFQRGWLAQLVGEAASGKSLLLQQLGLALAEAGWGTLLLTGFGSSDPTDVLLSQNEGRPFPEALFPVTHTVPWTIAQLESMLGQAPEPLEVLLVDDLDLSLIEAVTPASPRPLAGLGVLEELRKLAMRRDLFVMATCSTRPTPLGPSAQRTPGSARGVAASDLVFELERTPGSELRLKLAKNRYGPLATEELVLDPETCEIRLADGSRIVAPPRAREQGWQQLAALDFSRPRTRPSSLAERSAPAPAG